MTSTERLPVAIDAMVGDKAPAEIVAGAVRARDELGVPVVLVGRPEELGDVGGLEVIPASEVIAMDADPGKSVRTMKDSSLVRAAEAVRDGKACAMVSAGNTGATMASALLRMKRLPGVGRPAIATPIPCPGADTPTVLLDAGANAECTSEWLVQFAQMGSTYARHRYGIAEPKVGLLSIGEEPTKGTPLVKETHALLAEGSWAATCGGWRLEAADARAPDDWPELATRLLLDGAGRDTELLAYHDVAKGQHRFAAFTGERCVGLLFAAATPVAVSRTWAVEQLGREVDVRQRLRLLAGRPGGNERDRGTIVCACFDVGRNDIIAAIVDNGCNSLASLGERVKAGTNCGSCRSELTRLIAEANLSETA